MPALGAVKLHQTALFAGEHSSPMLVKQAFSLLSADVALCVQVIGQAADG
jgi:hypothetical protein